MLSRWRSLWLSVSGFSRDDEDGKLKWTRVRVEPGWGNELGKERA